MKFLHKLALIDDSPVQLMMTLIAMKSYNRKIVLFCFLVVMINIQSLSDEEVAFLTLHP